MFDVTHISKGSTHTSNVTINSVSGIMSKSTEKSKVVRFHMNSELAKSYFDEDKPHRKGDKKEEFQGQSYDLWPHEEIPIIVIQVMLCGGDNYLVEYLDNEESK